MNSSDVLISNEGSIFLFTPVSAGASEWLQENVQEDAQWFGNALVVEHRYALALAHGLQQAGFEVR